MSKFHLKTKELVQGEFKMHKVNVAFVFQVNCPGCFIYGIPILNELYSSFNNKIGFIGVATAFEDFEYNNEASLKLLLESGTLVGETLKYYRTNYGISTYSETLNFPVAFDFIASSEEFINSDMVELICDSIPNFENFSEIERKTIIQKVKSYYSEIPVIVETFTVNQLKGTPSFIVFDDEYNILGHYFGHQSMEVLKTKLNDLLA